MGPDGHQLRRLHPHHIGTSQSRACRHCGGGFAKTGYIYKGSYSGQYCVFDELYVDVSGRARPARSAGARPRRCEKRIISSSCRHFRTGCWGFTPSQPDLIRPETRRNEVISFVRSGLRDLSISRSTFSWGIPVPGRSQTCDLRLAGCAGQLHHRARLRLGRMTAKYKKYWPADVQMIGKEIVRFHCVYWPAFLMAAGLPLPKADRGAWLAAV